MRLEYVVIIVETIVIVFGVIHLLGYSELLEWLRKKWYKRKKKQIEESYKQFEKLGKEDIVNKSLLSFYSGDKDKFYSIEYGGSVKKYPFLTTPAWLNSFPNINKAISGGLVCDEKRDEDTIMDENMLDRIKEDKKFLNWNPEESPASLPSSKDFVWNDDCYRLINCPTDEISLSFSLTDYFSYLSDCEKLAFELFDYLVARKPNSKITSKELRQALDYRQKDAGNFKSLVKAKDHFYKLGVNVLTVLKTSDETFKVPIFKRSSNVVEFPNRYHVTPAGTFQPIIGVHENEFNLQHAVLREYGEELFNREELGEPSNENYRASDEWIFGRSPEVEDLRNLLENGDAHLWFTGFGFDMLAGKPELTVLLLIENIEYANNYIKNIKMNWEFKKRNKLLSLDSRELLQTVEPSKVVPAGAVAFFEGLTVLKEKLDISTPVDFSRKNP